MNGNMAQLFVQDPAGGYWRPKDRQEIRQFVKTMDARAFNTLKATRGAKKILREPEGQQSMNGVVDCGQ